MRILLQKINLNNVLTSKDFFLRNSVLRNFLRLFKILTKVLIVSSDIAKKNCLL